MGIRLSGMVSGLDTDSIIKEMMKAQGLKKTKIEQKKSKLEWSQDKWKELNAKIYNLYTSRISSMRLENTYQTKKVTSSNEAVLTATASSTAATGSHTVQVKSLASSQYVTSEKVLNEKGEAYKLTDKLTDLGMEVGTTIRIANGVGKEASVSTFEVKATSTINEYVVALQNAGLNASYDTSQGRFFISSKHSGEKNMFSIETINPNPVNNAKKAIEGLITDEEALKSLYEEYDAALQAWVKGEDGSESQIKALEERINEITATVVQAAVENEAREKVVADKVAQINENKQSEAYQSIAASVNKKFFVDEKDTSKGFKQDLIDAIKADYPDKASDEEFISSQAWLLYNEGFDKAIHDAGELYADTEEGKDKIADMVASEEYQATVDDKTKKIEAVLDSYKEARMDVITGEVTKISDGGLDKVGISNISIYKISPDADEIDVYYASMSESSATIKQAGDARIILDDAEITGTTNNFTVAGLSFDLKTITKADEVININVSNDISAVTNMVKDFVKEYNSILQEMNDLYFANLTKGYEPLTDEEKSVMSEGQIEMWEDKIKSSLLRRDPALRSVLNVFRSITDTKITVGDNGYNLSSFGITTKDYTEKGILHIFGDTSDNAFPDKEDLLTKMFEENPEEATAAFTGIIKELYTSLQDKMKSTTLSSALSFYNDKQMNDQMDRYEKDIKEWERKLDNMEDRYYKQFTAMEKAMSTLNSQSNSLASLMGTNNNSN